MNTSNGLSHGRGPRLAGQRLALVTLLCVAFGGGFALAVAWLGPRTVAQVPPPSLPATATQLPATPTPAPTPAAAPADATASLPTLYIDIAPPEMSQLEAKRDEALETWILQSGPGDFVDAHLQLAHEPPIAVRLRLKGDWGDHFTGDKWSYRVETRDDAAYRGMTAFSLQDPSTRSYLNEWLFTENLRAEDVLAVRYGFADIVENGVRKGIYAVEEAFSKELVESLERRESIIIRYDEDLLWAFWSAYEHDASVPSGVVRFHIIDEFGSAQVAADPGLSALRDAAVGKLRAWWLGDLSASETFDVETTSRFWALADLWGAQHALEWHNLRYYYNPVTALLEPIGFDAQPLGAGARVDQERLPGYTAAIASGDAALQRAYVEQLWTYSRPGYLERLEAAFAVELNALRTALGPEFGDQVNLRGEPVLMPPWAALRQRQDALRELLSPLQLTYAYLAAEAPAGEVWLDVGNLTGFPISIEGLLVDDLVIPLQHDWLTVASRAYVAPENVAGGIVISPLPPEATSMPYVRVKLPAAVIGGILEGADVRLATRVWGLAEGVTQPVRASYPAAAAGPIPVAPSMEEALETHSFLRSHGTDGDALTMPAGTWTITRPLVLPAGVGLTLVPGTTLRFEKEAFLLARGPLLFQGTAQAPIVLRPLDTTWRGVVVLESDSPSDWAHVTVMDTDAVDVAGWSLTGAITFYRSPVAMRDVSMVGTRAEDALNTIRSDFGLVRTEFSETASDAFDADFCHGQVLDSSFHDIGADGIDTSGSQVSVTNVYLRDIGDKAVSAGESSVVTLSNVTVRGAVFGFVSKDHSHVLASDVAVSSVEIAALAAYMKKASYGPGTMEVEGLAADDVPSERLTLVQTGSWITLNGERLWGTDVDVDALYR